jgi:hypothetical protein
MNGKARLLRLSAMPERSGNGKVEQTGNTHFLGGVVQGVVRVFEKKFWPGLAAIG